MVTFIDNHDRNRFLTEAGGDVKKMQNALTFIYSCRGVPTVFQGTEQNRGNANGQAINGIADTWNRWSMQTKDYDGNVVADYFNENTDTYKLIGRLNELRQQYQALREGTQREMWSSPHYYAFSRRMDDGENKGPGSCSNYPTWQINATIPVGKTIEFKAIKKDAEGNVVWESGNNHVFEIGTNDCNCTIAWN